MKALFILVALLIGTPAAIGSSGALGNIRDRDIGTRTIDIAYNADNQVANVTGAVMLL